MFKRGIVVVGAIVLTVVAVLVIVMYPTFPNNMDKAQKVATEYLQNKYSQEMQCVQSRVSCFVDPVLYHIYFSPSNNPEMVFDVVLGVDFALKNDFEHNISADNYLLKMFEKSVRETVEPEVKAVWGDDARVSIMYNSGLYGFKIPDGLSEYSSDEELQNGIPHDVVIYIDKEISGEDADEYSKIFGLLETFKQKKCFFANIEFCYLNKRIEIDTWKEIEAVSDITEVD